MMMMMMIPVLTCRSDVGENCLPLLHFILKHGNVTVFEWRAGKQPSRVEAAELDFGSDTDEEIASKDVDNGEVGCLLPWLVYVSN